MRTEDLFNNYKRYLKSIAMDLVVVIVALAYIFYQMITVEPTNLNPLILLAQATMGIICGIVIKQALGENGFSLGYNSDDWAREEKLYNDACTGAISYMDKVDNFYMVEEIERKRNYRRQHLQAIRLKYDQWFDKSGNYIGTPEMVYKLDRKQRRILKKCINVKIYPLNLFSQYTISTEQDTKKELTDKRQRANNVAKNTVSAVLIAVIGVYFIPQIKEWSWASLISATFQVSIWILFGIIQLYTNFNYVVQDKVAILRKKKELICKFKKGCDNHLYDKNPYEDDGTYLLENIPIMPIVKDSN